MNYINSEHKNVFNKFIYEKYGIDPIISDEKSLFLALLQKVNRPGIDNLISYLSKTDFFEAPASTKFHGNFAGGLCIHSLNVLALLGMLNEQLYANISEESLIITALMHDLCKVNFYVPEYRNKKVYTPTGKLHDAGGNFQWEAIKGWACEDSFPVGHGEKSVIMLQNMVKLTSDEIMMIRWHMGPFASVNTYDFNNAAEFCKSVSLLYTADLLASTNFEETIA